MYQQDRDGNTLKVGDEVVVHCRVKGLHIYESKARVTLQTVQPIAGTKSDRTIIELDALQVVKSWGR